MLRRGLALLLLLLIASTFTASIRNNPVGPLDLSSGWQFARDPADSGLKLGWQQPDVAFPSERVVATGTSLTEQGIVSYRGVSWYRRNVSVPDGWSRVLLGFGAVDVAADLYVNGLSLGHFDDQGLGQKAALVDVSNAVRPDGQLVIVFRVTGTGGFGGIKQAVKLGQNPWEVMTGKQYALYLHDEHPDWKLPGWTSGGRLAWTVAEVEGSTRKTLVAVDGTVSPWAGAYGINFWLYDPSANHVLDFPPPQTHLRDGSSPIPVLDFANGDWQLDEEIDVSGTASAPFVTLHLTLLKAPHGARLYAALRPYTASGDIAPLKNVAFKAGALYVDGSPALAVAGGTLPDGGASADGDVSATAQAGALPRDHQAIDSSGHGQGLLSLAIGPGATVTFIAPATPGGDFPKDGTNADTLSAAWQKRIHAVQLNLPDRQLENAYYSSLAYILVEERGTRIHPGPLVHDSFWVRDASLIGYALERAGLSDAVRGSAAATLAAIAPNGEVTAITDSSGKPVPKTELDAPGQAAFSLAEYARYANDQGFLPKAYPSILAALRTSMASRTSSGLLPANESAEDLGAANQMHFWDDLWLLTGLQDGQWAAAQLGRSQDATELASDSAALKQALLEAIDKATSSRFIPNNAEDVESSAMARGSSPALWPLPVLDPASALVRNSFDYYDQMFIQPGDGAYKHLYGQWWPYGGLELAHDYLFLGQRDRVQQILTYTLNHQTAPGWFAWAEGVDPSTEGFGEGDMPHGWASAELVNLVRDMLLYEDGDQLVIGAGVPEDWAGKAFSIQGAPTRWGLATVTVSADGTVQVSGVAPPGGVVLKLPFPAHLAVR